MHNSFFTSMEAAERWAYINDDSPERPGAIETYTSHYGIENRGNEYLAYLLAAGNFDSMCHDDRNTPMTYAAVLIDRCMDWGLGSHVARTAINMFRTMIKENR